MRVLIENSKKIILNQVDPNERALIDDFVKKSLNNKVKLRDLYDIDNELDGVSLELTKEKKEINIKNPGEQVLAADGTSQVVIDLPDGAHIEIDPLENEGFLEVTLQDNIITIKALTREELVGTTKQYKITINIVKEGYDSVVISLPVTVLYLNLGVDDYETLQNLPLINDEIVIGNKGLDAFGIQEEMESVSVAEIDELF